jgi:hypothetical protein
MRFCDFAMESGEVKTLPKKRQRGMDVTPESAARVEAHKVRWEAKLQELISAKGTSSQLFSRNKINHIIFALERFDSMSWPVSSHSCFFSCKFVNMY